MASLVKKIFAFAIAVIFATSLSSIAFVQIAQANTGQWFFSFSKKDGRHSCGPVLKNTAAGYIDLSIKKGDNVFVVGSSKLDLRGRYHSDQRPATYNYAYSHYHKSTKMNYLYECGSVNTKYILSGRVDAKSGTNVIQVWGYWTP